MDTEQKKATNFWNKPIFSYSDFLNRRNLLFGVAALMIVFYHLNRYGGPVCGGRIGRTLSKFFKKGNTGVDIFILLSAIGLCSSMKKNSLKKFYLNRFKRLIIPFWTCSIIFFIWYDFVSLKDGFFSMLLNLTTVSFWIYGSKVYPFWYVAAVVVLYLLFPLINYLDEMTRQVSTVALIVTSVLFEAFIYLYYEKTLYTMFEIVLSRVPIFLLGILVAKRIKDSDTFKLKTYCLSILYSITAFFVTTFTDMLPGFIERYIDALGGIAFALVIVGLFKQLKILDKVQNPLCFIGKISLEVYCVHIGIIRVMNFYSMWNRLNTISWYIIIIVLTLPLAYGFSVISKHTIKMK